MRFLDKLTERDLKGQRSDFLTSAKSFLNRKFTETSFSVSDIKMNSYVNMSKRTGIESTGELYITGESPAFKFTIKANLTVKYMTLTKGTSVEESHYSNTKVEYEVETLEAFNPDRTLIKLDKKTIKSFESALLLSKKYNQFKSKLRKETQEQTLKMGPSIKGYDKIKKLIDMKQQEINIEIASKESKTMNDKDKLAFEYKVEVFNVAYANDEQFVIFDKPLRAQVMIEATKLIKSYDAYAWAIQSFWQQKDAQDKNKQILQALKKLGKGKIYTISGGPQGTLTAKDL